MTGVDPVAARRSDVTARSPEASDVSRLPLVDEHEVVIQAAGADVWPLLLDTVDRAFGTAGAAAYARAVGSANATAGGPRPLAQGSTVPGFRVVALTSGSEIVLVGRHRFSSYALILRLSVDAAGRSRLRAESRADFPGLLGGAYRLVVVRSGGHVIAVRRLLRGIKQRAESALATG